MNENQVVQKALEKLSLQTGIKGRWKPAHNEVDGALTLLLPRDFHAFLEAKRKLRQYQFPGIFEMAERYTTFMVVLNAFLPGSKKSSGKERLATWTRLATFLLIMEKLLSGLKGISPTCGEKRLPTGPSPKKVLESCSTFCSTRRLMNLAYCKLAKATGVALGNIVNIIAGLREADLRTTETFIYQLQIIACRRC